MQLRPAREQCEFSEDFAKTEALGVLINLKHPVTIGKKRNLAAELVESEFILTMDDDDFSLPKRISSQVAVCSFSTTIHHRKYLENWKKCIYKVWCCICCNEWPHKHCRGKIWKLLWDFSNQTRIGFGSEMERLFLVRRLSFVSNDDERS